MAVGHEAEMAGAVATVGQRRKQEAVKPDGPLPRLTGSSTFYHIIVSKPRFSEAVAALDTRLREQEKT